jgi:hypothetical protein
MLFNHRKQGLHDRIANTVVIEDGTVDGSLPAKQDSSLLARDEPSDAELPEDERSIRHVTDAHRAVGTGL